MSETTNVIRQAANTVTMMGILKESDFNKGRDDKGEYISGRIVLSTDEHTEHRIDAFSRDKTKDGKENSAYKGLQRVMDEYVSMAKLMKDGATEAEARAQATKLAIRRGNLRLNEYYDKNSGYTLVSDPRVSSNYFSRVNDSAEYKPQARFEIEGFIDRIVPEVKGDEETGRVFIDLIVPQYGGKVEPMRFVATKEASQYISDHYEPHQTVELYGDIVSTVNKVVTRKAGFAAEEVAESTTYVRELLVDNGIPSPYDEDDPKAYKLGDIQAAMRVRDTEYLPEMLAKQKKREAEKAAGNKTGFTSAAVTGKAPSASTFSFADRY